MSNQLARAEEAIEATANVEQATETDKKSAATRLVEMAMERYEFGISTVGEAYALPKSGPKIVALLRGSKTSLRGQLAREYFRETRKAAPQQALADALAVSALEAIAKPKAIISPLLLAVRLLKTVEPLVSTATWLVPTA